MKTCLMLMLSMALCLFYCTSAPPPLKEVTAQVIVLCDVSNSTTLLTSQSQLQGRLDKLKGYVQLIPRWYPMGSKIYFYPVSNNLVSEKMAEPVCYDIKASSQVIVQQKYNDSLMTVVKKAIDTLAVKAPSSCLLFSIKRAVDLFSEWNNETSGRNRSNQLIIISDMLETCKINDVTDVQTTALNTAKLTAALNAFSQSNPNLTVSGLNLSVRVIINSPWIGNRFETVREAWENWFLKIGVRKENLKINTEQPNVDTNPQFEKSGI